MAAGMKRLLWLAISVSLVFSLLAAGCAKTVSTPGSKTEGQTPVYTATSAPGPDIRVTLSLSGPPMLGQPVQLTATFALAEGIKSAANVTARVILPGGLELVSGKLTWQGDMVLGTEYKIAATIRAVETGDWMIEARASYRMTDRGRVIGVLGGTKYLWALVYTDNATVSDRPTQPTEAPAPIPSKPPTEPPPRQPGEQGKEAPAPLVPSPSSALPSGGTILANPLVVTGGFSCNISENAFSPPPGENRTRNDVILPMALGKEVLERGFAPL